MTPLDAVLLGLVQGIAEFLPISSSGHLIIAREALGLMTAQGLAVDAVLQLATALAVTVYFRHDLYGLLSTVRNYVTGREVAPGARTLLTALALGTIPAVVAGLLLEEKMETTFREAELVAWVLLVGSLLFLLAEWVTSRAPQGRELSIARGCAIGLFQTLALVPGMSRSGATISGGMLLGLSREGAARFSFLLSLPIILGSGLKKLLELGGAGVPVHEWYMIALAAGVALASGLAAIHYLLKFLREHTLVPFVVYRVALAVGILAFL